MKKWLSIAALYIVAAHTPVAAQDILQSTVLAYDRKANVIVFTDRSVFHLDKLEGSPPENLKAGDRVELTYDSSEEEGVTAIFSVKILPK